MKPSCKGLQYKAMIKLTIEDKVFLQQLNSRVNSVKELTSPSVMQEVAKAAFTITGSQFAQAVDRYSVRNPKKMHHVYEWGQIGNPSARLFVIRREGILSGNLDIDVSFKMSKMPVPIPSALQTSNGMRKVTSRNIFKDKANVMESGRSVTFIAKKVLTFLGDDGQVFVAPGTQITINNPGGIQTKNAFQTFMVEWYIQNAQAIMDSSGFYETIAQQAAKAVESGAGTLGVRKAVASVSDKITTGREVII